MQDPGLSISLPSYLVMTKDKDEAEYLEDEGDTMRESDVQVIIDRPREALTEL